MFWDISSSSFANDVDAVFYFSDDGSIGKKKVQRNQNIFACIFGMLHKCIIHFLPTCAFDVNERHSKYLFLSI